MKLPGSIESTIARAPEMERSTPIGFPEAPGIHLKTNDPGTTHGLH